VRGFVAFVIGGVTIGENALASTITLIIEPTTLLKLAADSAIEWNISALAPARC
jgi:hypothetical protein